MAWQPTRKHLSRLSATSKHHLADPALAARLVCVRVYAQNAEATTGHLRTHSGDREIDLIVEGQSKRAIAIEVKLKRTIKDDDVRNLRWLEGGESSGIQLFPRLTTQAPGSTPAPPD